MFQECDFLIKDTKNIHTVVRLKSGVQKIRTFAFLPNRTFPKNPDFHQKPLHMGVRILSEPLYIRHDPNNSGPNFTLTLTLPLLLCYPNPDSP